MINREKRLFFFYDMIYHKNICNDYVSKLEIRGDKLMLISEKKVLFLFVFIGQIIFLNSQATELLNSDLCEEKNITKGACGAVQENEQKIQEFAMQEPQYRDLTPSEMDEFRKSLTESEIEVIQSFVGMINDRLNGSTQSDNELAKQKMEEVKVLCESKKVALRVLIQIVPMTLCEEQEKCND